MKLRVEDNELHIILSPSEAAALVIDHGENELVIPAERDTVCLALEIGDCLRELEPE